MMDVVPYAAAGTGAGIAGGVLAALWQPGERLTSLVQHFAAGVVLGAAALELMPDLEGREAPAWVTLGGFALGAVCMYLLRRWAEVRERTAAQPTRLASRAGLIGAVTADVLMDGIIVGAGFAARSPAGPILAIGLSVELLFLGLSLAGELGVGNVSTATLLGTTSGVSLVFGAGAIGGAWAMAGMGERTSTAVLSFGAAALIYLVTEELLSRAHVKSTAASNVLVLFLGFLGIWAMRYLGTGE